MNDRERPHVTVAALAIRDGRFLIVEENIQGRIVYNQPAGHLEADESPLQACIRETLEETAWHFRPEFISGVYRYHSNSNDVTYLRMCFFGRCTGHEPDRRLDEEIIAAHWLRRDEIVRSKDKLRSPMVLRCIDDYLAGSRYPLELITDIAG